VNVKSPFFGMANSILQTAQLLSDDSADRRWFYAAFSATMGAVSLHPSMAKPQHME
jgi:hypothetical protein